ncbi:MAG: dihydroxy-acid dehydratase, partial [Nitratireductor sp.]
LAGGAIARIRDGDMVRIDAEHGVLEALVDEAELARRPMSEPDLAANQYGLGRELFAQFRQMAARADEGAAVF